jgi:hypothetical protein
MSACHLYGMSSCFHDAMPSFFKKSFFPRLLQASPSTALPHSINVIAEKQSRARGWFGIGPNVVVLD